MMESENKVSGYSFTSIQEYKEAKREAETIDYIRANTNLKDLNKVLKLYHKLVERQTLKTIVGYGFLKELQDIILKEGIISKDSLPCIKIEKDMKQFKAYANALEQNREQKNQSLAEEYRIRHRNSRIINIFLVIIIIAMIMIAYFSNRSKSTVNEEQTTDKYSAWEEELKTKEADLQEREAALIEKEAVQTQE